MFLGSLSAIKIWLKVHLFKHTGTGRKSNKNQDIQIMNDFLAHEQDLNIFVEIFISDFWCLKSKKWFLFNKIGNASVNLTNQ